MSYTCADRNRDFEWFLDNYDQLYRKYGHKVFAIQNKKILGIYDNKKTAFDHTSETYEPGTFIVQEDTGDASGYTREAGLCELA